MTQKENGSGGTDHAQATGMFLAGGRVQGGVYNCDNNTWSAGDLFSSKDRYLRHKSDYRAIFAEIFTQHFGDDPALLNTIIPGYAQAVKDNPQEMALLHLLASTYPKQWHKYLLTTSSVPLSHTAHGHLGIVFRMQCSLFL